MNLNDLVKEMNSNIENKMTPDDEKYMVERLSNYIAKEVIIAEDLARQMSERICGTLEEAAIGNVMTKARYMILLIVFLVSGLIVGGVIARLIWGN